MPSTGTAFDCQRGRRGSEAQKEQACAEMFLDQQEALVTPVMKTSRMMSRDVNGRNLNVWQEGLFVCVVNSESVNHIETLSSYSAAAKSEAKK